MGLQSQVLTAVAEGMPGVPAVVFDNHFAANQKYSASTCYAGKFVFVNATTPNEKVDASNAGTQAVDGIVMGGLVNVGNTAGMGIAAGQTLTVFQRGKIWVQTESTAAVGDQIYAKNADGTPAVKSGATEGYTPTNFKVVYVASSASTGSLVVISNQDAQAPAYAHISGTPTVDTAISATSTNAVTNAAIKAALDLKQDIQASE